MKEEDVMKTSIDQDDRIYWYVPMLLPVRTKTYNLLFSTCKLDVRSR